MQRQHVDPAAGQRTADPVDLAGARHEDEDVAVPLGQRPSGGRRDVVEEGRGDPPVVHGQDAGRRPRPDGADRVQRARHVDDGDASQQGGEALGLHGGRHRDERQVLAQRPAHVEQQGQQQVGVQRPLVHLVEHHGRDSVEPWIGLQPAQEQPAGDDLDAGR